MKFLFPSRPGLVPYDNHSLPVVGSHRNASLTEAERRSVNEAFEESARANSKQQLKCNLKKLKVHTSTYSP
jgi:hypothetical protein